MLAAQLLGSDASFPDSSAEKTEEEKSSAGESLEVNLLVEHLRREYFMFYSFDGF